MTRSFNALHAKKLTKSAFAATAVLAGAAALMAPGTAASATTTAATATVIKVSYSDVVYRTDGNTSVALSFATWKSMGFPAPTTVGKIPGTTFFKYGTSADVLAQAPGQPVRVLTFSQWAAAGAPTPVNKSNEGLIKLSWAPEIARMTNLSTGAGYPLSMNEWANNGFTKFAVQQRIRGDQFYQNAGSADVWYAGPGVNRKISFSEWIAAGAPKPTVRGVVAGTAASSSDQNIVNIARKFIGTPYVWGGTTPRGFDCSGFTSYVYRMAGISLPRTSQAQWGAGRAVSESQARPGDLVVMSGGGHIGIYTGNGNMIDSPKPGSYVTERKIWASTRYFVTFR